MHVQKEKGTSIFIGLIFKKGGDLIEYLIIFDDYHLKKRELFVDVLLKIKPAIVKLLWLVNKYLIYGLFY